jgi:hypothetical protein
MTLRFVLNLTRSLSSLEKNAALRVALWNHSGHLMSARVMPLIAHHPCVKITDLVAWPVAGIVKE